MSEHVFKFLVSELGVVRVVCKSPQCGAVTELPVERITSKLESGQCPVCRVDLFGLGLGVRNPLVQLADAIVHLQRYTKALEVEFVLPDTAD